MKLLLLLPVIFFTGIISAQNPIEKEGWELTFNDEFNAKALDYSVWQDHYYWGGRFNKGGLNYYGTEQFQFSDSSLIIVAEKKKAPNGMEYVSGMIDSHKGFKQQYGYFEIRSKNPTGTGFWPAFWLVSTADWPPEIDVFEFYTSSPDLIHTNQHWKTNRDKRRMQAKKMKMEVDASADFHTYAAAWTKKKIKWFYDGEKIKTSRRGMKYLNYKMHLIINNEISDFKEMKLEDAVFPNYFEIDYVRVYKKKM